MSFAPLEYVRHIHVEARFLHEQTRDLTKDAFLQNGILQRAFVRSIEIMGEAAKKVPEEIRTTYPQIPWRIMAGMRDRLIHGYFEVDYDIVWNVAAVRAVPSAAALAELLERESAS